MTKKEMYRNRRGNQMLGSMQILAATLIWGFGFSVIRDSLDLIPLPLLMSWRYLIAFILLMLLCVKKIHAFKWSMLIKGALMGFFLYMGQYFQTEALSYADTTAGKVAFITALYVVFVPFMNWGMTKRRPALSCVISVCLAVPGLFLLSWAGTGIGTGDLIALVGSFGLSLHIIVSDRCIRNEDVLFMTALQFGFAFLISFLVQSLSGLRMTLAIWNGETAWPLIYMGVFSTLLGFLFQLMGQKRLSPEVSSVLLSMEAVFGMLFSVFLFGEPLSMQGLLGCVLMMVAILYPKGEKESKQNKK